MKSLTKTRGDTTGRLFAALAVLFILGVSPSIHAQTSFSPVTGMGFPQVEESAVAWGDFNNDGFLDFVIIGTLDTSGAPVLDVTKAVAKIYRNNGDGSFTDINAGIMPVAIGAAAWGDYDNDGFLDLVVGGIDTLGNNLTRLYHNNGNGTFSLVPGTPFHSVSYGGLAWGDYNNDGYLDLVVSAFDSAGAITKLYQNQKNGTFAEVTSANLLGVNGHSKVAFGDYDNDGYPDLLICGRTNLSNWLDPQSKTKLFHNNHGNGTFTEDVNAHFVGVARGAIAFGDFNNDGYLDVYVTGLTGPAVDSLPILDTSIVYLNHNGDGSFTAVPEVQPPSMNQAAVAVGDYDGDGILDLVVDGYGSNAGLYKGVGNGTFTNQPLGPPEVANGGVAWGDFNNDGYLDALVTGTKVGIAIDTTILYRNTGPGTSGTLPFAANTPPAAPLLIGVTAIDSSSVRLTWGRTTDAKTPSAGITYNLRVGTTPGGGNVISPLADSSGRRRIPAYGPQGTDTTWVLHGLSKGRYYWSVQAIDNGYAGSPLAAENTFTVGPQDTSMMAIARKSIAFDSVMVATSRTDSLWVKNGGNTLLKIFAQVVPGGAFGVTPDSVQVAAGDSTKFFVAFTPSDTSRVAAKVVFSSIPSTPVDTVSLSGRGFFLHLSQVRALAAGSLVSFVGTVTRAYGSYVYLQDTSGGLALHDSLGALSDSVANHSVTKGSILRILGRTANAGHVLQIGGANLLQWEILGSDTTMAPIVLTLQQIAAQGETFESRLVQVRDLRIVLSTDSLFKPSTSYTIVDPGDTAKNAALRIGLAANTQTDGTPVPKGVFVFTGIVGQADTGSASANYYLVPIAPGDVTPGTIVSVAPTKTTDIPRVFTLQQNYPNPFNPSTTIGYALPRESHVSIQVYNVLGQHVATLVDQQQAQGVYSIRFDGTGLASGIYFYRMITSDNTLLKKMLLLK